MLAHLGVHLRQELEKVVGPPVADDPIDLSSPQPQHDGGEACPPSARGQAPRCSRRQYRRSGSATAPPRPVGSAAAHRGERADRRRNRDARRFILSRSASAGGELDQEPDVGSARAGRRLKGGASRGAASYGANRDVATKQSRDRMEAALTTDGRSTGLARTAPNAASPRGQAACPGSKPSRVRKYRTKLKQPAICAAAPWGEALDCARQGP
jgi:hypothetical protein